MLRQMPRATTVALPEPSDRAAGGVGPPLVPSLAGPSDAARPCRRARRTVVRYATLLQHLPPFRAGMRYGRSRTPSAAHATAGRATLRQRPARSTALPLLNARLGGDSCLAAAGLDQPATIQRSRFCASAVCGASVHLPLEQPDVASGAVCQRARHDRTQRPAHPA
jgi:hypothetical protein